MTRGVICGDGEAIIIHAQVAARLGAGVFWCRKASGVFGARYQSAFQVGIRCPGGIHGKGDWRVEVFWIYNCSTGIQCPGGPQPWTLTHSNIRRPVLSIISRHVKAGKRQNLYRRLELDIILVHLLPVS